MTFSILACDSRSNELGAAVASFAFGVGPAALWARPGAGIVLTQMMPEPNYGVVGLDRMQAGEAASAVLVSMLATDPAAAQRQLAMVDARGRVAGYTGAQCVAYAGHRFERGISAQGAMLVSGGIWDGMYEAFAGAEGTLSERLISALEKGRSLGGDIRGHRSAALVVVRAEASERPWRDRIVDLRIDDHADPVAELRRLLSLQQLYASSNNAFEAALSGDMAGALCEFARLERTAPKDPDVALRHGILLALSGDAANARQRFEVCYHVAHRWQEVVRRLALAGFIPEQAPPT
ncbi:MAG: DUF1028 domain-containing protein [Gemmatimonadota bacterium]|nr:DUF1028 domain-containing protein [Gemmatimonadota bacterium]